MTGLLYASAAALIAMAGLATLIYSRAISAGHREYVHVIFAALGLFALEFVTIPNAAGDGTDEVWLLLANLSLLAAMVSLARRFRRAKSDETMIPLRNALTGYAVMLISVLVAIVAVELLTKNNKKVICGIAGMIAYVPAAQFPEESDEDFLGWIRYREVIRSEAREICDGGVNEALDARVEVDRQLLRESGFNPDEVLGP